MSAILRFLLEVLNILGSIVKKTVLALGLLFVTVIVLCYGFIALMVQLVN